VLGCHFEVNTTGLWVGIGGDLTTPGTAHGLLSNIAMEGNGIGIDIAGAWSGILSSISFHGETTSIGGVASQTSSYGLRCQDDKVTETLMQGLSTNGVFSVAGLSFGGTTGTRVNGMNLVQGINASIIGGGGVAVAFPTGISQSAAGWQFIGGTHRPAWTFSNLPNSSNANDGDEFDITDGPSSPTFGQQVTTGGGSTHVKVRWNSSTAKWTVCGI
jgi:hypothetical protein